MQLHELKSIHKPKKSKCVGRGGKRGTYCGRGMRGQKARSGGRFQPIIRELIKRYPKLRGYRFKSKTKRQKSKIAVLNLEILENKFNSGEKINPEILLEKRLVRKILGRTPKVKILGRGKINKSLTVEGCEVSKQAKEKIEKAGGKISQ
ncbi:MAG: 50S ribosomal protein L15 [Candidatus Nealsonbacteria bacterium CG02_land_8_20_14_3_00_37_10]|uniref:Large ribosomal subunit protein uL15 n=2 Tax=Candidatus Nealsoniibacteriota TaxID=1817911 RepID=A0A2G9YYX1_9BACT|nr:MAG: 50S ribosomal protein L15 [Candidatus Nealsonbacteria bacterium CG23_combo_of_CG06-09_8_20_14_all_37_18]PIV45216.1 MAG: 50S ribosomal protein L15 [Candidatus Nealsonbacteria bacterium CG02_land_8_20_14_3_00_37_10]